MDKNLTASQSIQINSTTKKLWDVLTNPETIKFFLYGTETLSDWKVGSPIIFQGEYNGTTYKDRGNVLENRQNELLSYNYWSGFSGLEDKPENYSLVSYKIERIADRQVIFTWTQNGFASKEGQCHTEQGLIAMLEQIKKLAEQ
jgi:uncharacterized protein YndB with AHSA1/START domain